MYYVVFGEEPDFRMPILDIDDEHIDQARDYIEKMIGKKMPLCIYTDYPYFSVYDGLGNQIGGG